MSREKPGPDGAKPVGLKDVAPPPVFPSPQGALYASNLDFPEDFSAPEPCDAAGDSPEENE